MAKLPVVTEETKIALSAAIEREEEDMRAIFLRLEKENPVLATFLLSLAKNSEDPETVLTGGLLVYRLLEKQAETAAE